MPDFAGWECFKLFIPGEAKFESTADGSAIQFTLAVQRKFCKHRIRTQAGVPLSSLLMWVLRQRVDGVSTMGLVIYFFTC